MKIAAFFVCAPFPIMLAGVITKALSPAAGTLALYAMGGIVAWAISEADIFARERK